MCLQAGMASLHSSSTTRQQQQRQQQDTHTDTNSHPSTGDAAAGVPLNCTQAALHSHSMQQQHNLVQKLNNITCPAFALLAQEPECWQWLPPGVSQKLTTG